MQIRCKPIAALSLPLLTGNLTAQTHLDTVVVTATRQETRVAEVLADVTVIEREEIERNGQDTITELLARQPGIQAALNGGPGTTTSFYLRGAKSDQTKVLVDGIAINSADLSGSPLRFMPLSSVERIEILRGPAATLYGADAIGGVIHIITRRGVPGLRVDGFAGYGSKNTRQASTGVSGGNEQWRFRIEADHSSSDGFPARRHATNRDAENDLWRNSGGAASLSFTPAQGHEIGASWRRNEGVVNFSSFDADGNYDDRTYFTTEQWQIFSRNRLTDFWTSRLQYGEARDHQKTYEWDAWALPAATEKETKQNTLNRQLSWQNDVTLPLGKLLLATEHLEQKITPGTDYALRPKASNNSILAGWTAAIGDHNWQINARHDQHSEFGGENTWSAAYGYRLSRELRAHVSAGTAFKAPSIYQLYMTSPWGNGNPHLSPEKSRNHEAGLSWDNGTHNLGVLYYHNRIRNLIVWESDPVTWVGTYENVGKAHMEGLTLTYAGHFGNWSLRASYDYLEARDTGNDFQLGRRARNKAMLGVSRAWGPFEAGLEVLGVGRRYDNNTENNPMGGYGLVNLTARYAINPELAVEARLNNLFDKPYETAVGYNTPGFNAFVGLRYSPK
ncbi:MAG: TonB-dependent receptor [Betaproteobacteria bacterium]|nr:TonB-dependent receptor [Betaproteobacteria bacterium]